MKYTIFLNGEYAADSDSFYQNLIKKSDCSIAVDGAMAFFEGLGVEPDIALGDFDSSEPPGQDFGGEILGFEVDKDKTDGELALEVALERGADEIALCGYRGGPATDQILGNLLLLQKAADSDHHLNVYCLSAEEKVWFVRDKSLEIAGASGDNISIVALDNRIRLGVSGVRWPLSGKTIRRGTTTALSNVLQESPCHITVRGAALVFWRKNSRP